MPRSAIENKTPGRLESYGRRAGAPGAVDVSAAVLSMVLPRPLQVYDEAPQARR